MSFNNNNKHYIHYNSPTVNGSKVYPVKHINQYYDLNYIPIYVKNPYVSYTTHGYHIVKQSVQPQTQYSYYVQQPQVYQVPPKTKYIKVSPHQQNIHQQQYNPSSQYVYQQQNKPQVHNVHQQQQYKPYNQQNIHQQQYKPHDKQQQYMNQQMNQPSSQVNIQSKPLDQQNNNNNNNHVISDEQYVKQVEELKKKFGYNDEEPKVNEKEKENPQFNENELFDDEIIDIESMRMNEEFMLLQKAELEEYNIDFNDPLLKEIFETTEDVIKRSKEYRRIGWPIWELSSHFNNERHFKVQSSLGIESKVDNDVIEDDWILVDSNQNKVSFDMNEHKQLEINLLSEEPDIQSIMNITKKYGVRNDLRAFTWQLLLGYVEPSVWKRAESLEKKRREYYKLLENKLNKSMTKKDLKNLYSILLDTPRTKSDLFPNILKLPCVKSSFERVLYIWSSVYNSISYFQGLNEIAFILFHVFLETALSGICNDLNLLFLDNENTANILYLKEVLINVEADVYFCLDLLLKHISKVYPIKTGLLFTEPISEEAESIIKQENLLLWKHITDKGISFNIFLFRWILCLFSRELSMSNTICLLDSYISEGENGLAKQHVYTVAAFLLLHSNNLLQIHDDEELMRYLLKMPTSNYTNKDILKMVNEANRLKIRYTNKVVAQVYM